MRDSICSRLPVDYTFCSNMIWTLTSRRLLSLLSVLMPLVCALATPTLARAQTDQSVYTDALINGWQNWSWATVNLGNTTPLQSGTDSISVSAGPYQALYLHQTAFDSTPYTALVFWINGGATGGQLLQVQATLNGAAQTVVTLPALAANTWQQVSIPLSSLGVQNQPDLDGFWIQDRSGTTQPTFFVDTISIKAQPPPSVVNVTVNAAQPVRTIDPRHFAVNTAVWDADFDTNNTINLLTRMGALALRFPGGSLPTTTIGPLTPQTATPGSGRRRSTVLRRSPPRSARKPSSPSTTAQALQPRRPHGSRNLMSPSITASSTGKSATSAMAPGRQILTQ